MIVLIVSKKPSAIRDLVHKHGHSVLFETDQLPDAVLPAIELSPHLLLIDVYDPEQLQLLTELKQKLKATRFVLIERTVRASWKRELVAELRKCPIILTSETRIPTQRQILLDPAFTRFLRGKQLALPGIISDWEQSPETQDLRLMWMLRAAKQNRERTGIYQDSIVRLEGMEFQEIGYRLVHQSYKGPEYARVQVGKYLGFLAHFVPGTDINCLPTSSDPIPELRFVPYGASLRMIYAIHVLALFGMNLCIYQELMSALDWCFTGQACDKVTQSGIRLSGCVFSLRAVMTSHATTIDWLLDPQTIHQLDVNQSRYLHRSRETFRDFWGFGSLLDDPERLRPILMSLADKNQPSLPADLKPPSFAQFYSKVDITGESAESTK